MTLLRKLETKKSKFKINFNDFLEKDVDEQEIIVDGKKISIFPNYSTQKDAIEHVPTSERACCTPASTAAS